MYSNKSEDIKKSLKWNPTQTTIQATYKTATNNIK